MIATSTNRRSPFATAAGLLAAVLALTLLAGAVGAAGASGAQTAANETTLTVGDATVEPNANDTARVSLDRVPEGLAGFEVVLTLEDAGAATITGASYPDDYQPTTDPAIGESGRTITLEAADLGNAVQPGATNVTLATVSVTGDGSATAELTATDLQVDADGGSRVDPAVEAGTVKIGATGEGGAVPVDESRGEGGAASDDASAGEGGETAVDGDEFPSGDGVLGLVALAVVAGVLGVGVFVWRD